MFGCSRCDKITDVGLGEIAARCPLLQFINLYKCVLITDVGLAQVAASCRQLSRINVGGCDKVTDEGLEIFPAGVSL